MKRIILLLLFMSIVIPCFALNYPTDLWKGLIAEETNPANYREYYALACCYRNRLLQNYPLGCVGLKRKNLEEFIKREITYVKTRYNKDIKKWSKLAIREVLVDNKKDITGGATHYENIEIFGIPYWTKAMIITCKIGKHTFYKEK